MSVNVPAGLLRSSRHRVAAAGLLCAALLLARELLVAARRPVAQSPAPPADPQEPIDIWARQERGNRMQGTRTRNGTRAPWRARR